MAKESICISATRLETYATDQGSYGYDAAGNLTSDSHKGLLFSYNLANLPSKVEGVGYNAGLTYSYGYLSDGTKTSADCGSGSTAQGLRYRGSFVYEILGGEVERLQSSGNRHRFGGKEEQRIGSTDLKLLDFGARYYDAFSCRWTSPDPLAEKYPGISPYAYCAGNPVILIDKDGTDIFIAIWTTGYNHSVGHAGIAISNYKKETFVVVSNGVETTQTRMIPDGTYTFYDNWPGGEGVSLDFKGALKSVPAYRNQSTIHSFDEFINGSTVSPSEEVGPNAVAKISTSYEQDMAVSKRLLDATIEKQLYNGAWYNCSTYVSDALTAIFGKRIGEEKMLGPIQAITPNQLWKDFKTNANEKGLPYDVLKNPGQEVDIQFKSFVK